MTENLHELHMFGTGDNIGLPLFATGSDSNPRSSQQPNSHSPVQYHNEDALCLDDNFVTDQLSRNDCLSDDTHFERQALESNQNSIQPSPTKSGPSAIVKVGLGPSPYSAEGKVIPIFPGSTLLKEKSEIRSSESKEGEIDISEFIDNFLGDDDLMHNVPEISDSIKMERSSHQSPSGAIDKAKGTKLNASISTCHDSAALLELQSVKQKKVPSPLLHKSGLSQEPNTGKMHLNKKPGMSGQGLQEHANRVCWSPPHGVATAMQAPEKRAEKRKPRTYSQAVPSQHCHICSRRPTEGSPHQVCGNLQKGRCRKTICTKCFHQFRWDLKAARDAPPGTWECPHCRGQCPQRAQCVIYNRTSDRRRLKLINHRKRKSEENGTSKNKTGSPAKKQAIEKSNSPNSGKTMMPPVPSLDQDKANVTTGTASKARTPTSNSKKANASKSRKTSAKTPKARKDSSRKEQRKRTFHASSEKVERDLSGQIPGVQRATIVQHNRAQTTLDHAEMREQTRAQMLFESNSRILQEHLNQLLTAHNGVDPTHASYVLMNQDFPDKSPPFQPSLNQNESSPNSSSVGLPTSTSQPYSVHNQMLSGDGLFSVGMNAALAQTELHLEQVNSNLQPPELDGRIQRGALSIEDIWPKTTAAQHEFEASTSQETPEDLWMLPEGPLESVSDDEREQGLNLLEQEDAPLVSSGYSPDRLYHGTRTFDEKEPLIT